MPGNPPYVRHDSQIVVTTESTQGTTETPTRTLGKVEGDVDLMDPTVNWLEERSISTGGSRELTGKQAGQNVYDGGSLPVIPIDGYPLAFLLGSDTVTADTGLDSSGAEVSDTGTTLHTITPTAAPVAPSMTLEAAYFGHDGGSDFVRTFGGATPPTGTIQVDNESKLSVDMDMLAMNVATGSSPTTGISEDARDPWIFTDAESDLSIAGTTYARVTNWEHEITTNAEARHYIQSATPEDPFEILLQNLEYQVTATIVPDDDSLYQELVGRDDAGDMNIQFNRASSDERLRFEYGSIGLEEAGHPIPEEGSPEVEVTILPNTTTIKVEDTQATSAYV